MAVTRPRGVLMSLLTRPWFWLLACLLVWVVLIVVQIAMGMGTVPGKGA